MPNEESPLYLQIYKFSTGEERGMIKLALRRGSVTYRIRYMLGLNSPFKEVDRPLKHETIKQRLRKVNQRTHDQQCHLNR